METCEHKYAPGEPSRITVNGSPSGDVPGDFMPLHAGDIFARIYCPLDASVCVPAGCTRDEYDLRVEKLIDGANDQ